MLCSGSHFWFRLVLGAWLWEPDRSFTYGGRTYLEPATISTGDVARDWAPLRDMRTEKHGKQLFIPELELRTDGDPTVVLLRSDDGRYDIYGLSGGP